LDKKLVNDLGCTKFVADGLNVLIMGPTGVGKTHLATALGNAVCRKGRSTMFYPINLLMEKLLLARAQGTYLLLLRRLASTDLLIIDDFGIKPLTPPGYQDPYDILDDRAEGKSTIITTQLPPENWSEAIGDPVVCESIDHVEVFSCFKKLTHSGLGIMTLIGVAAVFMNSDIANVIPRFVGQKNNLPGFGSRFFSFFDHVSGH
jgi:DNA replication protein DnaC